MRNLIALAVFPLLIGACEAGERVLEIDATGAAGALVYLDRDGNRQVTDNDAPATGVRITLVRGGSDTVASTTTNQLGLGLFIAVPVGSYRVAVDGAALGDSLVLASGDSTIRVAANDTVGAVLALDYPLVRPSEVRTLDVGRAVTVEGVALHGANLFGDSALHIAEPGGAALRIVGLAAQPGVGPGDSVRVLGRAGAKSGQAVLTSSAAFRIGTGRLPAARRISTRLAADAEGGVLDASLVEIADATVINAARTLTGDVRLRVDDGSGPLEIVLDREAQITSDQPLAPGVIVSATGVLVPGPIGGVWELRPRASRDLRVTVRLLTIAEARAREPGWLVAIEGIALHAWAKFGDGTLHVADTTAAIRVVASGAGSVYQGDSVRVVGVLGVHDGQPALTTPIASRLAESQVPPAREAGTGVAAHANHGALDAELLVVRRAAVQDTATVAGDFHLSVDDGSGLLRAVLDRDAAIGMAGYVPGATLDITGVLVPLGAGGGWMLKPRSKGDIR